MRVLVAGATGAIGKRRVPPWIGRLFAGEFGVVLMTELRGASNAPAVDHGTANPCRQLGWAGRHASSRLANT
jgi:hypothetical protein